MSVNHSRGFTLIEVLVALSVFSVMAVLTFGGMDRMFNFRNQVENNTQRLENWQMAFSIIKNDLEQAVNRPVRDNLGSIRPAFLSNPNDDTRLRFTTQLRSSFQLQNNTSGLQRVEYRIEDNVLYRDSWSTLDRAHNAESESMILLENLQSVDFRFIDQQEQDFWPLPGRSTFDRALPRAVRIAITTDSGFSIERLFMVSGI